MSRPSPPLPSQATGAGSRLPLARADTQGRWSGGQGRGRLLTPWSLVAASIALLAALHTAWFAVRVPLWQTPDEPTQFEYAALVARLGRVPAFEDRDLILEREITASMAHNWFWELLTGSRPAPLPGDLEQARQLFFMPRQAGVDPPLYFVLAAVPLRILAGRSIDAQALTLRLLNVVFVAGAALASYGAARELLPADRAYAAAVGLFVALQPMFAFAAAGVGNDAAANCAGAATIWLVLRAMRRRQLLALVAAAGVAGMGLLTKRTMVPLVLVLTLAALAALGLAVVRSSRGRRAALVVAAASAVAIGGTALIISWSDPHSAAGWYGPAGSRTVARVARAPGTGAPAIELGPGGTATQALPDAAGEWTQNQTLRVSARVWSAGAAARGRLLIDVGWGTVAQPFEVWAPAQEVVVATLVPLFSPYVHVAIELENETLYLDQIAARSERRPDVNLLDWNGDVRAGWHDTSPQAMLARSPHIRALSWALRSGRLLEPPPLGWQLPRIFFASFWGQFGWMSVPLVGGSRWEPALAGVCLAGCAGAGLFLARNRGVERRITCLLLLVVAAGALLPLLNAYLQPRSQAIQQGRYMFAVLTPVGLLLALGWRTLVPPRWHSLLWIVWSIWWVAFAAAAGALVLRAYG